MTSPPQHQPMPFPDLAIYSIIGMVLLFRLVTIAISPLGLDVEEAQYWQWSTQPDAGYFTKPPMIAWVIGASTSLFGSSEFGVRAFAPVMQAVTAVLMLLIGRQAGGASAGRWAAVIWISLPVTALGGFIMSTDSPMITFLLAALLLLAPLAQGQSLSKQSTILAGLMLGAAMMAKYAAVYLLVGLALWWVWQGRKGQGLNGQGQNGQSLNGQDGRFDTANASVSFPKIALFTIAAIISLAPNIVWNLNNSFVTVGHLGDNANLDETVFSLARGVEFLISQMGVVGPLIAALAGVAIWRLKHQPAARFWIALGAPALVVVTAQSLRADANANWALASWPPLIILTAVFISQATKRIQQVAIGGIVINAGLVAVILTSTIMGSFGPLTPSSDPLRRLRGWDQHHHDLSAMAHTHQAEAIITTRREHIAKMIWHYRHDPLPIEIIDPNTIAENHFEQRFPWQAVAGRTIILINQDASPPDLDKVRWLGVSDQSKVKISDKRDRVLVYHLGVETP